jgi:hypothetical protein
MKHPVSGLESIGVVKNNYINVWEDRWRQYQFAFLTFRHRHGSLL